MKDIKKILLGIATTLIILLSIGIGAVGGKFYGEAKVLNKVLSKETNCQWAAITEEDLR